MVAINSRLGLHPDEISRHSFPNARRGYDPDAVRQYLQSMAAGLQEVLDREQALRRQLAEAERRAAEPELDEATLTRAVGAETARILQAAHDAAGEVAAKAEAKAAEILGAAEAILSDRQQAAEAEAVAIVRAAETEAEAVTESARSEAVALLQATRAECRRIVREARALRAEVLSDLAEKRRGLRVQLEELRAGRDFLIEVVQSVGVAAGELQDKVARAEHEARVAAAAAGEAAEEGNDDSDLQAVLESPEEGVLAPGALGEEEPGEEDGQEAESLEEGELENSGSAAEEESPEVEHARSRQSVDELFARIRADREEADEEDIENKEERLTPGAEQAGVLADHSAHEAAVEEADESPEEIVGLDEANEKTTEVPESATEATEAPVDPAEGEGESEAPEALLLARRKEVLGPITSKLSRALKRALQDDQNFLLDAIRHASGVPELGQLLPEESQRARLEEATSGLLAEAWSLGHRWPGELEGEASEASSAGQQVAAELALEVTGLLRHRLSEALGSLGDVGDGAADAAGAAYREWRGRRVERTAGDFATAAFSQGVVTGAGGAELRWVVDDDGEPCPDCDDNALAGPVAPGEEFPTGQRHPPIHAGCRCLLVVASS